MAVELNRENYETEVEQSGQPVLVDIWGPQCKPCLALMPQVEALEREYKGKLKLAKLNATENRMLCAKLRVVSLPAFLFYKDGKEVNRVLSDAVTIQDIKDAIDEMLV
jgi:thioredoxin 1